MLSYMRRGSGFYREVVILALPILIQNLVTNAMGLLDTFMVGLLGELPLAAVALANIPCFVVTFVIFGIQSGSSVLISQNWGKGDTDAISRVLGMGLYTACSLTLVFSVILFTIPLPFMSLFGNDPAVIEVAAQYARIIGFSYLADAFVQIYIAAHRSMENPKLGMYILGVTVVSNTFLNWVLIFGRLGFKPMGVTGAALATLLARCLGLAITLAYALTNKRFRLRPAALLRPGAVMAKQFFRYATPVVFNETTWGLGTALYATIMGHMEGSKEILAAYAIAGNIERVCTVAIFAVAGTSAIIVGREVGAGKPAKEVYDVGACLNMLSVMMGAALSVVLLAGLHIVIVPYLYPVFELSEGSAAITTTMLTVVFSFQALRAFNTTNIVGVLRGGGDVQAATLIDTLPQWCVALPLTALAGLVLKLSILWVYLAMMMEGFVKLCLGLKRLRSGRWIHDLTIPGGAES